MPCEGPEPAVSIEDRGPVSTIAFPVSNSVIGITVNTAPEGLVVTFNGDNWIELTDSRRPRVLYTFVANDDRNPTAVASSIDEFERNTLGYDGGAVIGQGTIREATEPREKNAALNQIMHHYSGRHWEFDEGFEDAVSDADGTPLGTQYLALPPWGNDQVNRVFGDFQPLNGFVDVVNDVPNTSFTCYGSVLDNTTSDPTTIPPQ